MSVLSATTQKQVEEQLVREGLLEQSKLTELHQKANKNGAPVFSLLISEGGLDPENLTKVTAQVTKVPYVNLTNAPIDQATLELLPHDIAERYMAVPLGEMQHRLVVAMLDADNVQAVDFLSNKIGRPLKVYAASERGIRAALSLYKASLDTNVAEAFSDTEEPEPETGKKARDKKNIKTIVQDSPISKALSTILEYAAKNRASDIHIEPLEKELKIRCRIDGVLREIMKLPKSTEPPLVSRIKILSNLKIDEHRIPQDGQFTVQVDTREIDLRIAISPVVWGEQVVIRLLDRSGTSLNLEDMGYTGRALRAIRQGIANPNGLI
ncbi:MAG: ATPase, T2SS/T4P/T4SS family, partial [Candidatus Saccharimonadales bacterium]